MSGHKKIFTVFGATGLQGGSVVSKFLADAKLKDEWTLRGVTRDTNKDSAKKLVEQGVEVVTVCIVAYLMEAALMKYTG